MIKEKILNTPSVSKSSVSEIRLPSLPLKVKIEDLLPNAMLLNEQLHKFEQPVLGPLNSLSLFHHKKDEELSGIEKIESQIKSWKSAYIQT
ncbi:MAG: hypothetical protein HYX60_11035 [Legionella longbeachae]|nr:hypothetical protein [Legionella longbeachae]